MEWTPLNVHTRDHRNSTHSKEMIFYNKDYYLRYSRTFKWVLFVIFANEKSVLHCINMCRFSKDSHRGGGSFPEQGGTNLRPGVGILQN